MAASMQTNVKAAPVFFKSLNFWATDGVFRSRLAEKVGQKAPFPTKPRLFACQDFFVSRAPFSKKVRAAAKKVGR